jgi:prephenate dehydrogenase
MAEQFQRAAIVGLGLVGGSLAMVLRRKRLVKEVIAIDNDEKVLAKALHRNVVDQAVADPEQGLSQARFVVIAVPDHLTPQVLTAISGHIEPGAVVCDVGRIKGPVLARAAEVLSERTPFVGCHPVVLKEGKDLDEAYPALFQNRPCILTPGSPHHEEAVRQVRAIWEEAGCRVEEMDAERHDRLFAVLEDLPTVLLQLVCRAAGQLSAYVDDLDLYSGRELREITKLAAKVPPQMVERLWANRQPLQHVLNYYRLKLKEVSEALQGEDPQELAALLLPRR